IITSIALSLVLAGFAGAEPERTEANDGNLLMEDVPAIPASIVEDLNRYQNVRSARFLDWALDTAGAVDGIYVATRFADVDQVHRVDRPGGARRQLTWFDDPVGEVRRRPGGRDLVFTRDAGG